MTIPIPLINDHIPVITLITSPSTPLTFSARILNSLYPPLSKGGVIYYMHLVVTSSSLPSHHHNQTSDKYIRQSQGKEELPPEPHDLIIPQSREGPPLPD